MGKIISLVIVLAIIVALFAVFRSIILWYFKIDEKIKILKKIEENTRKE